MPLACALRHGLRAALTYAGLLMLTLGIALHTAPTLFSPEHPLLHTRAVPAPTDVPSPVSAGVFCPASEVQSNADLLFALLEQVTALPAFGVISLDLNSPCALWEADDAYVCELTTDDNKQPACLVSQCDDADIPLPLLFSCGDVATDSAFRHLDDAIHPEAVASARRFTRAQEVGAWIYDNPAMSEIIDLRRNPESFTGYSGRGASAVWTAIYNAACLPAEDPETFPRERGSEVAADAAPKPALFADAQFGAGPAASVPQQCAEQDTLLRLISGLHGSVTVSIADSFDVQAAAAFYGSRIASAPDRVQNLYFSFMAMQRAAALLGPHAMAQAVATGESIADRHTLSLLRKLSSSEAFDRCAANFNETELFNDLMIDGAVSIGSQRRLAHALDAVYAAAACTDCTMCRLHAKVTIQGIAAALRVLTAPRDASGLAAVTLSRTEAVALVNTLHRFAETLIRMERISKTSLTSRAPFFLASGSTALLAALLLRFLISPAPTAAVTDVRAAVAQSLPVTGPAIDETPGKQHDSATVADCVSAGN
jgi:hypothetical protein